MERAIEAKFTQNEDLKTMLIETGDVELCEHTENDKFWADGGGAGKGENMLGKLLMKLRDT